MYIEFPKVEGIIVQENQNNSGLPKMLTIRQSFDDEKIIDIPGHIKKEMEKLSHKADWFSGKRIAITSGSRGIPNIHIALKAVCDQLKEWGALPFIVPAMGSHGGATAEGQKEVLESFGITEEFVGVPICSSMDVVHYGDLPDGTPLYCDKLAFESDGIVVMHKVKPHTDFRGEHESGLLKMIAIGLGKHKGAAAIHSHGFYGFEGKIVGAAKQFLEKAPVAFAVGIVQNAYDELCTIEVAEKEDIFEADARLLKEARTKMAGFKFDDIDVLIIDEIGKNISGFGFDPNIVGRSNNKNYGVNDPIQIKRLFIRGLTPESHHNGCGLVAADITTRRCINDVDWAPTWTNFVACTEIQGGKIPMYLNNDRDALLMAIRSCGGESRPLRMARIKNTLCMFEMEVSEALYDLIKDREDVELVREAHEIEFDREGFMV